MKSLTNVLKKSGQITEPCGTPDTISCRSLYFYSAIHSNFQISTDLLLPLKEVWTEHPDLVKSEKESEMTTPVLNRNTSSCGI